MDLLLPGLELCSPGFEGPIVALFLTGRLKSDDPLCGRTRRGLLLHGVRRRHGHVVLGGSLGVEGSVVGDHHLSSVGLLVSLEVQGLELSKMLHWSGLDQSGLVGGDHVPVTDKVIGAVMSVRAEGL